MNDSSTDLYWEWSAYSWISPLAFLSKIQLSGFPLWGLQRFQYFEGSLRILAMKFVSDITHQIIEIPDYFCYPRRPLPDITRAKK